MIIHRFTGVSFGSERLPEEGAIQFTIIDPPTQMVWQLPLPSEAVIALIKDMANLLTEDQKKECLSHFTSGIAVPGSSDFNNAQLGLNLDSNGTGID